MRSEEYSRLIRHRDWRRLRLWYLSRHPLCEDCEDRGRIRPATEVHHIVPIDSCPDVGGKRKLAYDPRNLRALCKDCHHAAHEEMESRCPAVVKARTEAEVGSFVKLWLGGGRTRG